VTSAKSKLPRQSYSCLSTGHITRRDNEILVVQATTNTTPVIIVDQFEYGYWLFVPTTPEGINELEEGMKRLGCSAALVSLIVEAYHQTIGYIKFDCDGGVVDGLPKFEW